MSTFSRRRFGAWLTAVFAAGASVPVRQAAAATLTRASQTPVLAITPGTEIAYETHTDPVGPRPSIFGNVAAIEAADLPRAQQGAGVVTLGYHAAGDGGAAAYDFAKAQVTGPGKIRSADGAWWELRGERIDIRQFGAKGDGSDATVAIGAANAHLASVGGGSLYFPAGRYGCQNITPCSGVDYFGDGDSSQLFLVENSTNTAHIFFSDGLNRSTYHLRAWTTLKDVLPGNDVQLANSAEAANFAQGDLVLIVSSGHFSSGQGDEQPFFSLINQIVSVSHDAGVLTLESPILDPIRDARITRQNDFTTPGFVDQWCAHASFHDLCFDLSTTPSGIQSQALSTNGLYRCHVYDVTIDGASFVHAANGDCYSQFENIRCINMRAAGNSMRVLEIKTGSYASSYRNIYCDSARTATVTMGLLEAGEYAQRITFDTISFIAPNISITSLYVVGPSGTIGNHYKFLNINFELAQAISFISTNGQSSPSLPDYVGHEYRNCAINSPKCAITVRLAPNDVGRISEVTIDGVIAHQPPAASKFGGTTGAIYISSLAGLSSCMVRNVVSDGRLSWSCALPASSYGDYSVSIVDCKLAGIVVETVNHEPAKCAQPWQIDLRRLSRFGEDRLLAVSNIEAAPTTSCSTVGDTVLYAATLPDWTSFGWSFGDELCFELTGEFINAYGAKTVTLTETTSGRDLAVVTSTTAAPFKIEGALIYYSGPNVSSVAETRLGSAIKSVQTDLHVPSGLALRLKGNIAKKGDMIRFYRLRVYPKLAFRS